MWFFFLTWHQSKATKATVNKWGYSKLKTFYTAKETINKMKRQSNEWEKISVNHVSGKKLISNIHKELTQFYRKKIKIQLKMGWKSEWTFLKEDIWITNKYMKRCPVVLTIREMQLKAQWDIILQLLEWLLSKRQEITIVDEHVEKKNEPLCTVRRNINWYILYGIFKKLQSFFRKVWSVFKKLKMELP